MNANCGLLTTAGAPQSRSFLLLARSSSSRPAGASWPSASRSRRACRLDRLAVEPLVLLHVGEVHEQVELRPGEHLVDVRILVRDVNLAAWRSARSGMMSHALTSSTYGDFDRCGKYWPETLPQPMTPTRTFFC